MKLSLLLLTATLVCFLSHASEGHRQLGVRVLLNQGKEHETAHCNEKEFEIVTKALSKMAQKSVMFDEAPEPVNRGRRQLQINCGFICCGFPLGMCGIYQSKCKGFPTTSSNQQYCSRRLDDQEDAVTEELSTVILLDPAIPEQRSLRGLQNDYSISEEKRCREIKKEAKIAINSVLDDIDDACADAVLLPARLQCFVSEA